MATNKKYDKKSSAQDYYRGVSVVQAALDLHMYNKGTYDMPEEKAKDLSTWLQMRLDTWKIGKDEGSAAFDQQVRKLIELVLKEATEQQLTCRAPACGVKSRSLSKKQLQQNYWDTEKSMCPLHNEASAWNNLEVTDKAKLHDALDAFSVFLCPRCGCLRSYNEGADDEYWELCCYCSEKFESEKLRL